MSHPNPLSLVERPSHVPPNRVVYFDLFDIPGADEDLALAYRAFQQDHPDIFWTPLNGGHWVATRAEDIEIMHRDYARFSQRRVAIPKSPDNVPAAIPLESDPPLHTDLRRPLTKALATAAIAALEPKIRELTVTLIDRIKDQGECDFVSEFAGILPIMVFLDLVDLPRDDSSVLVPMAHRMVRGQTAEARTKAQAELAAYLTEIVRQRRANPGADLFSQIVGIDVAGERITEADAVAYATLLLLAGLDTTVSGLALLMRFLATHENHRRQLVDRLEDKAFLRQAIEELFRHIGVANSGREIAYDFAYKGICFKKGEMILMPNMLLGLDERRVQDPLTIDFARKSPTSHAIFGGGPHVCAGSVLARREFQIVLEEWLTRIPDFAIKPGTRAVVATGMVNAVLRMEITWPSASATG